MGVRVARLEATAVLPTPVGPTMTGVRGVAFRMWFSQNAVPTLPSAAAPCSAGRDGGSAGVGRRKALEPVLPAAKAATGEIGNELLQAAGGLEAGMRVRRGVHDDAATGEWLDL